MKSSTTYNKCLDDTTHEHPNGSFVSFPFHHSLSILPFDSIQYKDGSLRCSGLRTLYFTVHCMQQPNHTHDNEVSGFIIQFCDSFWHTHRTGAVISQRNLLLRPWHSEGSRRSKFSDEVKITSLFCASIPHTLWTVHESMKECLLVKP